jgi:hypothetical protein
MSNGFMDAPAWSAKLVCPGLTDFDPAFNLPHPHALRHPQFLSLEAVRKDHPNAMDATASTRSTTKRHLNRYGPG